MNALKGDRLRAPKLSRQEIVAAAEAVVTRYTDLVGRDHVRKVGLWFDDVYDKVIYPDYEIQLVQDEDLGFDGGKKVLGRFDVIENKAYIDSSLRIGSGDHRRIFTACHEVGGHGILHGEFLRRQLMGTKVQQSIILTEVDLSVEVQGTLEWQANFFAKHFAAPNWLVVEKVTKELSLKQPIRFVGPGDYCLYVRETDLKRSASTCDELCRHIALFVRRYFWGLSIEALGYRIKECGLVIDRTRRTLSLRRCA